MRSHRTSSWPALLYGLALTAVLSGAFAGVVYHYRTPLSVRAVSEAVRDRLSAEEVRHTTASGDLLRGLNIRGISAVVSAAGRKWGVSIDELHVRLTLWPTDRLDWSAGGISVEASGEGAEIRSARIGTVRPHEQGWRLEGAVVQGVARLAGGELSAATVVSTGTGAVRLESVRGRSNDGVSFEAESATVDGQDLRLEDLRAEGLPGLKTPHTLKAQRVAWDLSAGPAGLREAVHAQVRIEGSAEPIMIIGRGSAEGPDLRVYSRSIAVEALKAVLGRSGMKVTGGSLTDVELHVLGSWREPVWTGNLTLDRVGYGRFEFSGVRVWTDGLISASSPSGVELRGAIVATGGKIHHTRGQLDLKQGIVTYYGDPAVPELDVEGRTRIGSAEVRIRIGGTPLKPQVRLGSDGALSQEKLLLMLATGQEWPATEKALEAGKATFDVTREFVDYFVLGGTGQRMKDRFGLRDLTLGLEKIIPFAGAARPSRADEMAGVTASPRSS